MCASVALLALCALSATHLIAAQYVPPEALVEPLKPAGIRISIPYDEGSTLVAFHVKFNEEFNGLEAGTIARDILKPKNGRWTYMDKTTKLNKGDEVHYWIHVVYNGLGYNLIDQKFTVNDFYDENGNVICELSETKLYDQDGTVRNICQQQILFEEKFTNPKEFARNNWTIVEQFSTGPDYEFVVYRNSTHNINIKNRLVIYPRIMRDDFGDLYVRKGTLDLKSCTSPRRADCYRQAQNWNILPPVSSARINTGKSLNFEYGRIEIRAKFPRGDWIYPVLMLEPVENLNNPSESAVQIRIASSVGNVNLKTSDRRDISGSVLWGGVTRSGPGQMDERFGPNQQVKRNDRPWSENFHNYELVWAPGRLSLSVDGQLYDDQEVTLPANTPYYLTIGVAVGGLSEFPDHSQSKGYAKSWRNSEAKLAVPVEESSRVQIIGLPEAYAEVQTGTPLSISGFGSKVWKGPGSRFLKKMTMYAVDRDVCQYQWGNQQRIGRGHMCAILERGLGACSGDSGSPLTYDKKIVVGVASAVSYKRCGSGIPDLFTKVSYYMDYIISELNL